MLLEVDETAVAVFFQSLLAGASGVSSLDPTVKAVGSALSELEQFVQIAASRSPSYLELAARDLAYSLARIYAGECFTKALVTSDMQQLQFCSNVFTLLEPFAFCKFTTTNLNVSYSDFSSEGNWSHYLICI